MMKKFAAFLVPLAMAGGLVVACSDTPVDTTPVQDAAIDKKIVNNDTGAPDTGPIITCKPGDVSAFKPEWILPNDVQPGACSTTELTDYYAKCYDNTTSNTTACTAFGKASAACTKCMVSVSTATKYGALISTTGVVNANIGGCIALKDGDKSATGCGAKYQAAYQCGLAACEENCPIANDDNNVSFAAYQKCLTTARTGVCKTYEDAKCKSAAPNDAVDLCHDQANGFDEYFQIMGTVFCGGYTSDAGAPDASSSDSGIADAADGG
ncbi:hypothetical protein BH09MYX1_BH09MYX1_44470 [soil metagenome]